MGYGYGDGPTCCYDTIPCDGCGGCCDGVLEDTPLHHYLEREEPNNELINEGVGWYDPYYVEEE